MKPGTKVRVIDAKEVGIPIREGETYTVRQFGTYRSIMGDEPELDVKEKAVTLEGVDGIFRESRFEAVS